jgi:hypothetical protein
VPEGVNVDRPDPFVALRNAGKGRSRLRILLNLSGTSKTEVFGGSQAGMGFSCRLASLWIPWSLFASHCLKSSAGSSLSGIEVPSRFFSMGGVQFYERQRLIQAQLAHGQRCQFPLA